MADDNKNEMACVYAALVLQDAGQEISEDKITKLVNVAGIKVEPYWPGLFAKVCTNVKIEDLINNIGSGPAAGAAPADGAAAGGEAAKEEVKEESEEEEEEEEMDFDLFD